MPSTYTTSGIELIADGEQSGTWGDTTNTNLEILNRLVSEAGTITLSGTTHSLTISDGVLSDGQYSALVFSGALSSTNTVTLSPNTAKRVFFLLNNTTESVVLSQGSGGDVTLPAGNFKIVYTDGAGAGAQVVDLTNQLAASLTGNVTGNLTGDVTGNVTGDVTGNVTGNANTATAWQTPRTITIGSTGKSVDGSANVNWNLTEIGVNDSTLTLATSGIATGSQTWTSNQGSNATFTVSVPATDLSVTPGTLSGPVVNSSTGTNVTLPSASATASGVVTTTTQTFAGTKTFSGGIVSDVTGDVTGNADTSTTLQTARLINGTSFNGSADITTSTWGTTRTVTIGGTGKSVNGSANVAWTLSEIGVGTLGQQSASSVAVTGGTINNTSIGASTPSTGAFTTFKSTALQETVGTVSAGVVNLATGTVFSDAPSASTTYSFTNPPASGTAYGFTLKVSPSATISVSWPASVQWPFSTPPTAPASGETDVYVFYTQDGGTTYYGFIAGEALG